jgi:rRNA maturation RNase YbeY
MVYSHDSQVRFANEIHDIHPAMILNRQRTVRVARPPLEAFLARVRQQLRLNGVEITVCLVSDPAIAHMNETFRHKKGPTDVLSFPSDEPKQGFVGASLQGAQARSQRRRVRAQDSCAPSPHDRSGSSSPRRRRTNMSTTVAPANRQGTASAVPNQAAKEGASAPEANHLGDIAISPATARRNAKKFRRTLPNELQILILHGVLHLLGYDHETDHGQMTRIENRLRRKLGLQ